MFAFLEIFLKQRKTALESRLQKFHWPSQQKAIDLVPLTTTIFTYLGLASLENKPFLTCNIYTTAIELRFFLTASFPNEILEIPAFGKSDTYITENIDRLSETNVRYLFNVQ